MTTPTTGRPRLTVVAGIPGSGIEPWLLVNRESLLPERFYDPDWIAHGIGDWNDAETRGRAGRLMNEMIAKDIRQRRSFGLKTAYANGTTAASVCQLATGRGLHEPAADYPRYAVHMYFIGTRTPTVNQKRVRDALIDRRQPYWKADQLEHQWASSMENMRSTIRLMHEMTLVNGSPDLPTLAVVRNGITERRAKRMPPWARTILDGLKPEKATPPNPQGNPQDSA